MAEKAAKLAAVGVVPRKEKLLQLRRAAAASGVSVKKKPMPNNNPERAFYDLWSAGGEWRQSLRFLLNGRNVFKWRNVSQCPTAPETADPFYLEQTKKKLVKVRAVPSFVSKTVLRKIFSHLDTCSYGIIW